MYPTPTHVDSATRGGYYDEDEEGSMDNFIIDDGLDAEEEVCHVHHWSAV